MSNRIKLCILLFVFLFIPIVNSQVNIEHIGFGKTPREAYFIISNIGDNPITDFTILVDSEQYKKINGIIAGPGSTIEEVIYLDSGEHLIEVNTSEGAYDSLTITITVAQETQPLTSQDELPPILIEYKTQLIISMIILFFMIVVLAIKAKPKI